MAGKVVTAIGTPNIALVKYWGRRSGAVANLPTNSSLSITLDETLHTKTSVVASRDLARDTLYINRELQDLEKTTDEKVAFTKKLLDELRAVARTDEKVSIVSENAFPTGAGLASSASGAATLGFILPRALGLDLDTQQLSTIARKISGSACRSMFGGFVVWERGTKPDGSDSFARSLVGPDYWPEIVDVITLVSSGRKRVSSSEGHTRTPQTSSLYAVRPAIAEERVGALIDAIQRRDFPKLAEITMKDSNSLHATMLDTYPPIMHLTDVSRAIIDAINELNAREGELIAAYTFDAGPNAQIITLERHRQKVIDTARSIVGKDNVLVAKQGAGPRLLGESESLIDEGKLIHKYLAQL
jgi:diphosphomevalonate decarboxylase